MNVPRSPTTRLQPGHLPEPARWRRTITAVLRDLLRWFRGITRAEFLEEHGAWITHLGDWWPF